MSVQMDTNSGDEARHVTTSNHPTLIADNEEMKNLRDWVGTAMKDIYRGRGPWQYEIPAVQPSRYHAVLYEGNPTLLSPPLPRKSEMLRHWEVDFVRLPYSPKNLFPSKRPNGEEYIIDRWNLIKEALTKHPITTSEDLETAIHSYNTRLPKFSALHFYFNEVLEDYESEQFFKTVLPGIIRLALQLPTVVSASIPLLKKDTNRAVTMSQMQVACLLANAFLCTFPWRRDMITYPGVNFVRLFSAHINEDKVNPVSEKLKCICHYFRKILQKPRNGVVTFKRKFIPRNQIPRWDKLDNNLGNTRVHISSTGTIEDNGDGLLQVDFANKYVGGGVLGFGCVQEEIRFVICPELILSRLFTEQLGNTEALIIRGAERYSNYSGYGDTFTWNGNTDDETPYDPSGRRQTAIVAIDAQYFSRSCNQFDMSSVLREVNKAYVGFHSRKTHPLPAVATGNWGCGAFRGNPHLKFLIQLMACSASNRDMVYFTFGDDELRDTLYNMYTFIATNAITVVQLWRLIYRFTVTKCSTDQFYPFIQQAYFDSKSQLSIKQYFSCLKKNETDDEEASTSSKCDTTDSIKMVAFDSQNTEDYIDFECTKIASASSSNVDEDFSKQIKKFKQSGEHMQNTTSNNSQKTSPSKHLPTSPPSKHLAKNTLTSSLTNPLTNPLTSSLKDSLSNSLKNSPTNSPINAPSKNSPKSSILERMPKNNDHIVNIIDEIDGKSYSKTVDNFNEPFLATVDALSHVLDQKRKGVSGKALGTDENLNEAMDVDDIVDVLNKDAKPMEGEFVEKGTPSTSKRKIPDYFPRKERK